MFGKNQLTELNNIEKAVLVMIVTLVGFIYTLFFCYFLSVISDNFFFPQVYFAKFWMWFLKNSAINLKTIIIFSVGEEVIWRILPLSLLVPLFSKLKNKKLGNLLLIITIIFLSWGFALEHSTSFNIFIQGVLGLMWSYLFLKNGGYRQKFAPAALSVIFSHLAYNLLVLSNGYLFVKWFGGL